MRLRLTDGTVFGGAEAVVEIARRIWWAWPLWAISRLPGAMRPLHAGYRWLARRRRLRERRVPDHEAGQPYGRQHPAAHRLPCRCGSFALLAAAVVVHVGSGDRDLRGVQVADVLPRARARCRHRSPAHGSSTSLRGPGWTRPRSCHKRSVSAGPPDPNGSPPPQDRVRCGVAPACRACCVAGTSLAGRLARDGRSGVRPALRDVPPAVARLANASASTPCR